MATEIIQGTAIGLENGPEKQREALGIGAFLGRSAERVAKKDMGWGSPASKIASIDLEWCRGTIPLLYPELDGPRLKTRSEIQICHQLCRDIVRCSFLP